MRVDSCSLVLVLLCWFLPEAIAAQQPPNIDDARIKQVVDQFMQPYLSQNHFPGAIVGVSFHGRPHFYAYGKATDAGEPFTPDTLVEIGSCTKVFTTTLFALAINLGKMQPGASAAQYMPSGFSLQPGAKLMTPLELADFTSGLPDDPTDLPRNHSIEYYTTKNFLTWISHWTPTVKLPAPYLYSNAGIGLLGYLITQATGVKWDDQLHSEILNVLNMKDTTLRPDAEQRKRLAQGHHANGQDAPPWPIFAWFQAGGLRSTARNMLRFGDANLGHKEVDGHPVPADLTAAMQLAQQPIYTMPNGRNKQGMAWVTNEGNPQEGSHPVILKDGGTVGFGSVIILNPTKDLALFIAVNQNRSQPSDLGIQIARHLP